MNLFSKIRRRRKERKDGASNGSGGAAAVAERLESEHNEVPSSLATMEPDPAEPGSMVSIPPSSVPATQATGCGPSCVDDDFKPWTRAYEILQAREPELMKDLNKHLASLQGNNETITDISAPDSVGSIVKQLLETREKEQWRVSLMGKEVKIRQQAEKLVKFLIWSDKIIKSALSTQPYAALAWSGVSIILPLLTSGSTQNEAMLKGFNTINSVQLYGKICEDTYLQPSNRQMYRELMEPLAELYSHIVEYQTRAICYLSRAQLSRAWQTIDGWNDWEGKAIMIDGLSQKYSSYISPLEADEIRRNRDSQLQKMQESQDILDEIRGVLITGKEESQRNYEDQKERALLQILASDYEDQKNINPKRVPGTCEWFFKDERFTKWKNSDTSSLLWVSAAPGCGKSVLSRALIDEQRLSTNITTSTICYFFFKDGDEQRMAPTNALCAVLHQLFTHDPDSGLIKHALESHKNFGESLAQNFSRLWQILEDCANSPDAGEIVCVLDALDEYSEKYRDQLIGKLKDFYGKPHNQSNSPSKLKFLIISRPYDSLEAYFARFSDTTTYLRFDGDEKSAEIKNEINLVIDAKLDDIARHFNQRDRQRISDRLKSMENRTYLWLYLTFDIIEKSRSEYTRRSDVETLLSKLPAEISEAYEKILDRSKDQARAKALLRIILAAARPLTLDEANSALTLATQSLQFIPYGDNELESELWPQEAFKTTVKNLCGLFVNVYDSRLYFIHQTAREFLLHNKNEGKWKGCLNMSESHGTMSLVCIEHLSYLGELELVVNDIRAKFPLAQYSAQYWIDHARSSETVGNVQEMILDFCLEKKQAYTVWGHLYNPDFSWDREPSRFRGLASPLYYASLAGLSHTVNLLLERGANINAEGEYGSSLHAASAMGRIEVVRTLLDKGADDNAAGKKDTAIQIASARGDKQVVQLFLDKGSKMNPTSTKTGSTIQAAAAEGYKEIVQLLLDNGADVNAKGHEYGNALQAACIRGRSNIIQLLLDKGSDVNAEGGYYGSVLQAACIRGSKNIVQLLLDKGAKVNTACGYYGNAIQAASSQNHTDIVRLLLDNGADVNAEGGKYGSALQTACIRGDEELVQLLLDRGADINLTGGDYGSALQAASIEGNLEMTQLLLGQGANVNMDGGVYGTAFQGACFRGHEDIARILLKSGASFEGYEEIVQLLLDNNANIDGE